jgi:Tfp pilus assembly protein PilX
MTRVQRWTKKKEKTETVSCGRNGNVSWKRCKEKYTTPSMPDYRANTYFETNFDF